MSATQRLLTLVLWSMAAAAVPAQDKAPEDEQRAEIDLLKPRVVLETGGHTSQVMKLFFTRDGKQLVTVGQDHTIRYWDAQTGEPGRVLRLEYYLEANMANAGAAALSPDRKTLALFGKPKKSANENWPIVLVNVDEGRIDRIMEQPPTLQWQVCLAFAPDGKHLAVGYGEKCNDAGGGKLISAIVWDRDTGRQVLKVNRDMEGKDISTHGLAFSPDGKRLAITTWARVRIVSVPSGEVEGTVEGAGGRALAWAPAEPFLAVATEKNGVLLWDALQQKALRTYPQLGDTNSLTWSPDGRQLLWTASQPHQAGGPVKLLDAVNGGVLSGYSLIKGGILPVPTDAAFAPDGKLVAAAGGNSHTVHVWNKDNGQLVWKGVGQGGPVKNASWSADGKVIAYGRVGDLGKRIRDNRPLQRAFDLAALHPLPGEAFSKLDLRTFFGPVVDGDGVNLIDGYVPKASRETGPISLGMGWWWSCGTLLPGDRAAIGGRGGHIAFMDTRTGKKTAGVGGHQGLVTALAPSKDQKLLLSASLDQTLKIWNIARPGEEKLLLTLFFAGADWIIWTPEGYYAATPGGEQLMGWTVFNGFDKLNSFYPAARFRPSLYRPDVIARVLEFGSVDKALEAADQARGRKTEKQTIDAVLPPRVRLTTPGAATRVDAADFAVEAEAESVGSYPVTAMHFLLDGRPYPCEPTTPKLQDPKLGKAKAAWKVRLPPGSHRLSVLAINSVSSATSDGVDVTYEPKVALDPKSQLPGLFVLAVGINAYPGDWKLNCAAKDAIDVEKTLKAKGTPVFREVQTQLLTDKQATRQGILDGLGWLKKQMKPQDVAVIFYAGHGEKGKQGQFYLLPQDVDFAAIDKTGVSGDEVKKRLAELPGRVLMLLDACHSGAIGARGKGALTDELTRELADDDCGVIVLCAAMGREEAGEERKLGHGYFALSLIEGLSGKADVSKKDGRIYLHHLEAYVIDRVQELSKDEQHPVVGKPTTVRSFALAKP